MKIFLLNQFFWPDASATSQLLTDLARALVDAGHEVTAISSDAGGYAADDMTGSAPRVRSLRVRALPFGRGRAGRIISYLSFYLLAAVRGLLLPSQDVILTLTTPPLLPLLGTLIKVARGGKHVIWEMDLYPDVATDLGYFQRGGVLDRFVGLAADLARSKADRIIALGNCMRDRLLARGVSPRSITVAQNWADGKAIVPLAPKMQSGTLTFLYSGNLGLAHDVETITSAMIALRTNLRLRFLFVGSGAQRTALQRRIEEHGLTQVELRPYVARISLSESLAEGDVGLVTQRKECCGSVVPSKVYGLLAAGRPILFIGPAQATPARLIRQFGCGWHIPVGESALLVELVLRLLSNPEEVLAAGRRARRALDQHFDLPLGVERVKIVLESVVAGPEAGGSSSVTSGRVVVNALNGYVPTGATLVKSRAITSYAAQDEEEFSGRETPQRGEAHSCTP